MWNVAIIEDEEIMSKQLISYFNNTAKKTTKRFLMAFLRMPNHF